MDNLKPHSENISEIPDILRGFGSLLLLTQNGGYALGGPELAAVDCFLQYLAADMEMQLYKKNHKEEGETA